MGRGGAGRGGAGGVLSDRCSNSKQKDSASMHQRLEGREGSEAVQMWFSFRSGGHGGQDVFFNVCIMTCQLTPQRIINVSKACSDASATTTATGHDESP